MAVDVPSKPSLWTLPNQLSLSRLALGVVLFVFIETELWLACIVTFALAAVTDWLDGIAARRLGLVSSLGRMLDPLIDKVVNGGAFIFLLTHDNTGLYAWMVVIIVGRELLITGVRGYMEEQGIAFGADWLGKIKMILQCAVLFAIFGVFSIDEVIVTPFWVYILRDGLIYFTVAITALSGVQYIWKAIRLLEQ